MRKITEDSINAFMNAEPFNKSNTEVKVMALENSKPCLIHLYLFDNLIAIRHINKRVHKIQVTNCGWKTNTTKERLNGIPGVSIYEKNKEWFLNDRLWNGELIDIT